MSSYRHITDYLRRNADDFPDKLALVTPQRNLSWKQLWAEVEGVAKNLSARLDSSQQQLVSLLMPNSWEYVVTYLAILELGHIVVPVDVIYKQLEIDAILSQMAPALVITDKDNLGRIGAQMPVLTLEDIGRGKGSYQKVRLAPAVQIATIFFTSGTTGKPKAAPYTHANHIWNIDVCSRVWEWTDADSLLLSLRLSHWYGSVMGLSGVLYHASTLYLQDRFSSADTLRELGSGQITMFTHAPLAYSKLMEVNNWQDYDLSTVRLFISGSGPLPPALWEEFKQRFGAEILEVYGSSETGRIASNLLNERIPGSPGRLLPGVDVKISEKGEVTVKSPGVFPGYYKNLPLSKASMTKDGYWCTGDIGEIKDGRLILKGRFQEIIRKQGYSISPRDVEWAVHAHPQVKEIAVLGVNTPGQPDDRLVYFITGDITEDQLKLFCKAQLPSVWRPDQIIKLSELPRSQRGKVDLPKLQAMLN